MKRTMKFRNLLYNIVMALFIGAAAHTFLGLNVYAVAAGTLATGAVLPYVSAEAKTAFMAIQVEIWQNHIEEEIFKDNAFLRMSKNADDEVINSKVVHIPQSGGSGNVVKNRTVFPAAIRERTDTDVVYVLNEYTSDPVKIPHADTKELSYDKRNSVLGEDRDKIVQTVAEWALYDWLHTPAYGTYAATEVPASRILLTSGANREATAPAATGERKAAVLGDLQRMQTKFRQENKWFEGRMQCLLPPAMLIDLFPADSVVTATYMQNVTEQERREGVMAKVQGWKVMSRSSVFVMDAANDFLAPGAAGATTDDEAALFWYNDAVEFAFGGVEAFEKLRDPQYYADIYSFLVRSGGRSRRDDYLGIGILRQGPAAI